MPRLTVERLFASPPLSGTLPTEPKFAPDGSYLAFLQAAGDDRERLDLWRLDLPGGTARCWLNARQLYDPEAILSDAEKAQRERKRLFSSGITTYEISPDGTRLLIPLDGAGYLLDVATETLSRFTPPDTRQTDFRFSPRGTYISYVRAGNLYYFDPGDAREVAVTADGGGTVASGIADFIAQEEMHRYEGHWWKDDESIIAFTRTDEAPVAVSLRYEIDADAIQVIEQRYPYAGAVNACVDLLVYDLASARTRGLDYRHHPDDYLARAAWAGDHLAVQVQSRDQRRLDLDFHRIEFRRPEPFEARTVLTETSQTWIHLHDNFRPLEDGRFLWTSERDGSSQLYLYGDGGLVPLTQGPGRVARILHADGRRVLYSGWRESPTEQHLFELPMDAGGDAEPRRLTRSPGWHELVIDGHGARYIDRWSALNDMGRIQVIDGDGGSATTVADENAGGHPYRALRPHHATPEIGTLQAEDGQTLYYRLTRPREVTGPCPLVVFVYGGPGVNRVRNEWAPLLLQIFAGRGFGVLELDNRGTANRDRAFDSPIHRHLGDVEVRDQCVGVRFAQTLDWVDGERIGVFGHSYGGYMTLMCLARAPELFRAGVAVAPVSDWTLYDTHYTERYLGTPAENPDGYRDSAVFSHLDGLRGKLLIMHGMADDNVLFTHSTKLFKALQSRRYPFEMMTYPGSKHALQEQDVSVHRFNLILDFFERSLQRV